MAISMDVGDSLNVHYTQKKAVGERLALLALRHTYHRAIIADAPEALYAQQKGDIVIVDFSPRTRLATANSKPLLGFELVNTKGERLATKAFIKNNTVRLAIPSGEKIRTVFYAMQPFTRANLVNQAGLPVSTFTMPINTNKQFLLN
jgi:sialate O-acetylesterase